MKKIEGEDSHSIFLRGPWHYQIGHEHGRFVFNQPFKICELCASIEIGPKIAGSLTLRRKFNWPHTSSRDQPVVKLAWDGDCRLHTIRLNGHVLCHEVASHGSPLQVDIGHAIRRTNLLEIVIDDFSQLLHPCRLVIQATGA
ncbi:MAG TPA: hypothetical protein PKD64_12870 [Pirellulaceae bacterium]|nr:hypothetical protein [Pirellulaceae bacterium]HMO93080.1 hypothetical protein [Pirellulaceae bacterium]HMP69969.1 hypothetical protein [Pirellulaceae bacterium]